jgi:hypothetical protein
MYTLPDQEASFPNPNLSSRGLLIVGHHSPGCSDHITTEFGPARSINTNVRVDYKLLSSLLWHDNQSTDISPKNGTETNIEATSYWSYYHATEMKHTHAHVFVRHDMTNMVVKET